MTRVPHYLLSTESRECLAQHRNPLFALKLLQAQSNSDAEAISAAGKELEEQNTKGACAGIQRKKEELLARCKQGTPITWKKGWSGGKGSRSGKIQGWLGPLLLKCT